LLTGKPPGVPDEPEIDPNNEETSGRSTLLKWDSSRIRFIRRWWNAFQSDYLLELWRFNALSGRRRIPFVGDVVLIASSNKKRIESKMGVVKKLFPGR